MAQHHHNSCTYNCIFEIEVGACVEAPPVAKICILISIFTSEFQFGTKSKSIGAKARKTVSINVK